MKYLIFLSLFIPLIASSSEIYKCKLENGSFIFSDKPCPGNSAEEKITSENGNDDWIARLSDEKSSSINITEVIRIDGDVTIKYEFITKSDSNDFLKLANSVSNIPVVLMKYIAPKENVLGRAEIKLSQKPNPLFDKILESKNRQ